MTLIEEGRDRFTGMLHIRGKGYTIPEHGNGMTANNVVSSLEKAGSVDLIVSDQRDTDPKLMRSYIRRAPVVAIDDRGAGRRFAHVTVFSLPTIEGHHGNFTGPGFLILDRGVRMKQPRPHRAMQKSSEVVVSFGGADPHNLTAAVTRSLNLIGIRPVVVCGPLYRHDVGDCSFMPVDNPPRMADILAASKVLITSFGMTLFEALYLGVPVILLNHSRYHDKLAAKVDGVYNLGYHGAVGKRELPRRLGETLKVIDRSSEDKHQSVVDGRGTERMLSIIEKAATAGRRDCLFHHGVYRALERNAMHTLMGCRKCRDVFLYELEGQGDIYEGGDYFLSEYEAQYGRSYVEDREHISRMAQTRLDIIERYANSTSIAGNGPLEQDMSLRSKRLLDVGCALGFFLDVAESRGWQATGVEVSEFAANWAREHLNVTVINSSFADVVLEPESYDVVTFFFVAEHFKDVEKIIERAYAALKRGGLIVCALPNVRGISARVDMKRYVQVHPKDHYFDTCPRNIARFLKHHGFHRCRIRVTGIHPERFFKKLGMGERSAVFSRLYAAVARVLRLGDTFEYFGRKT
jgi:2-polyprenyl-3-methyl-5-hydroxy-6-metoxy-1,4-benzoquinol methylase